MSRKRSKSSPLIPIPILILCAAVAFWIYDAYNKGNFGSAFDTGTSKPVPTETRKPEDGSTSSERTRGYETYRNCTLVSDRSNDADSFRILFPDGRKEIVRLYFVDSPESDFRTYRGGETNHRRIREQAGALGVITPEQAVDIGKKAKEFTLKYLAESPFTIYTKWDSPFHDRRYHAFVEIPFNGKTRFLHELLVEEGYARIHTKGAKLPDGTSENTQKQQLLQLQRTAKSAKTGVWAY